MNCLIGTIPVTVKESEDEVGPVTDEIIERLRSMKGRVAYGSQLWINHATGDIAYVASPSQWNSCGPQHALCELQDVEKTIEWLKNRGTWGYWRFSPDHKAANYSILPSYADVFP